MDNYVIYDNGEMKVEIDGLFHLIVEEFLAPYFMLEPAFTQLLLSRIATNIIQMGEQNLDKIIVCSNRAYLVNKYLPCKLGDPFKTFNKGLDYITKVENFRASRNEIIDYITNLYSQDNFLFEIYEQPLFGVDGYFCEITEEKIIIIFFSYVDI